MTNSPTDNKGFDNRDDDSNVADDIGLNAGIDDAAGLDSVIDYDADIDSSVDDAGIVSSADADSDLDSSSDGKLDSASSVKEINGGFKAGAHTRERTFVAVPPQLTEKDPNIIRRKKQHKKKKKIRKPVLISIIVVCLLAFLGVGAFASYKIGQRNLHTVSNVAIASPEAAVSHSEGKRVEYQGHTYELNEDVLSVLMIGFDRKNVATEGQAPGQADAVAVFAIDTKTGETTVIGIPRDSMVDVDVYGTGGDNFTGTTNMQLCLAYFYGDGADESCKNVAKSVSRILYNIPTDYYFSLDESGVGALADAVDGVPLTPLETIPGTSIEEGKSTILFDNEALRYVQYRDTKVLNSPLDRQERQAQFIRAFASQTLVSAKGNVTMLLGLYNTAADYSVTNLGLTEFTYLAGALTNSGITGVDVVALKGEMSLGSSGYAEYNLDTEAVYQTVLDVYYKQVS